MDPEQLSKAIDELNDEFINDEKPVSDDDKMVSTEINPEPVDYLRQKHNQRRDYNKRPHLKGSTQKIMVDVAAVLSRLDTAYQKAKDDSEYLASTGDKEGSRIVREQYMEDVFHPTIASLVGANSPEEMLNSKKALDELDKRALTGVPNAPGYTAAFITQLYDKYMGGVLPTSDVNVEDAVRKVVRLVQSDQIRLAIGEAQKIKAKIDMGENTASAEDYELIQKVALRGQ